MKINAFSKLKKKKLDKQNKQLLPVDQSQILGFYTARQ